VFFPPQSQRLIFYYFICDHVSLFFSWRCLLGFYNDHHFHYGYHIYAAAVVAHFDADWGRKFFEQVVMLVRDIANPSVQDSAFPLFRHKDWYQGNSWASGVPLPPYLNGKNQESSSEAIAAYEAVALYGRIMVRMT
jgi:endo-1,3(4)-beta-glucanase